MKVTAITILALLVGGTVASAQGVPSRIALLAFNQTNARIGDGCQGMIQIANVANRDPRSAIILAPAAWTCLRDVQEETNDPLPMQVPRDILTASCVRMKRDYPADYRGLKGYCKGV
jgi:hypothetical protein